VINWHACYREWQPFEKQHARPVEEAASVPNKPSLVPERLSKFTERFWGE